MIKTHACFRPVAALLLVAAVAAAQGPEVPPGMILVDDMILPADVFTTDSAFNAAAWPYGVIPYAFNANVSAANQVLARRAMDEISAVCGAIFIPQSNLPDWIIFNATTFNSSPVGRQGGGQTINITSWGTKYIIVHEIMHALGFVHEQSRPDRDSFVTINSGNVSSNGCPGSNCGGNGSSGCICNFNIINSATAVNAYDLLSIMHYGSNSFSANGFDTITCKPAYAAFQNQIGNRTFMTLSDAGGLQNRYGSASLVPTFNSISPSAVTTSTGSFTLHVYGSNFFEGSPNGSGVQGTKILWNGSQLTTTYVDSGHLFAQVAAGLISQPQTAQISVLSPSPAFGFPSTTLPLTVSCQSGNINLSNGVPVPVSNGCQLVTISPVYNAFNVVAVSSPSDWDIQMGTASSAFGGNTCDFVAGSGYFGAGTISPTVANIIHYAGPDSATVQHVTSTEVLNDQPTISYMPAGSIVRAFHFSAAAVSTRVIQIAGPSSLRWKLVWSGNSPFTWRSSQNNLVAQGTVGGAPVTGIGIVPAPYCLVVYSDGGPVASAIDFTINLGFDFTPVQLTASNNITTINQGPYSFQPFTITPFTNHWNVVGISSPSDWDIQIGPAVSQGGGSSCDYVLANGHLGSLYPLTGSCSPYVYPGSSGSLQFCYTSTLPTGWYTYTYMITAFEFEILTPGTYDIAVSSPGYSWDLHTPGTNASWKRKADRIASGTGNGGVVSVPNLTAGWYCVVVYHDGGPTGLTSPSISVSLATAQVPYLSAISPASGTAGAPSATITASGTGFTSSSIMRWNGTDLATTFGSASSISALVPAALLASAGTAQVTVYNPPPGGGTSSALPYSISNPAPSLFGINPSSLAAGGPATTLLANGSGFTTQCAVLFQGTPLTTTWVSGTQLSAQLTAAQLAVAGTAIITVSAPAPGGGVSAGVGLDILPPVINTLAPASIALMTGASPPVSISLSGNAFAPGCRVVANGQVLPVTFATATLLVCSIGPSVPQTTRPGGIAITVENTASIVSNTKALVVGSGTNQGTIRRSVLVPLPGQSYAAVLEGGAPNQIFSLYVDAGNPPPVTAWPTPAAGFVLAVSPLAGSAGPFIPLVEGIGFFGPPTGQTLDPNGAFTLPGFTLPNPPVNLDLTVQAVYVDPASPQGFRLSWSRWPDRL